MIGGLGMHIFLQTNAIHLKTTVESLVLPTIRYQS